MTEGPPALCGLPAPASVAGDAAVSGLATRWWIVFIMFASQMFTGIVWSVITVSFRQTIIPDALLGRVNSAYRFFGWGMIPIGSIAGGAAVGILTPIVGRSDALRRPYFLAAIIYGLLLVYARDAIAESGMGGVGPDDLGS